MSFSAARRFIRQDRGHGRGHRRAEFSGGVGADRRGGPGPVEHEGRFVMARRSRQSGPSPTEAVNSEAIRKRPGQAAEDLAGRCGQGRDRQAATC